MYRQLGDAAMVMALEELAQVEDRNLVSGHIATLFGDYKSARSPAPHRSAPHPTPPHPTPLARAHTIRAAAALLTG